MKPSAQHGAGTGVATLEREAATATLRGVAWDEAVQSLASAATPDARAAAFLEFGARVGELLPELASAMPAALAILRSAVAEAGFVEAMTAEATHVVDVVDLPTMTAEDFALEAVTVAGARNRILESPMLTAAAVSELLGSTSANARQYANRLRSNGDLVAVPVRNRYLYPAFQIDAEHRVVREAVTDVNHLLGAVRDPWGVAAWWLQPSALLGGSNPADELLAQGGAQRVLALAGDVAHGD